MPGRFTSDSEDIKGRVLREAELFVTHNYTVRKLAEQVDVSKSTVHTDVTLQNGKNKGQTIPESIEIKGVFLSIKNPVVRFGLVIR